MTRSLLICAVPGRDAERRCGEGEAELVLGVAADQLDVDGRVATVVDGHLVPPGALVRAGLREQLDVALVEGTDGDDAFFGDTAAGLFARDDLDGERIAARVGRRRRGGRNRTCTVSSAPGKSETCGGSTLIQPAPSPRDWNVNWSTTAAGVADTQTGPITSAPGATATSLLCRDALAPMAAHPRHRRGSPVKECPGRIRCPLSHREVLVEAIRALFPVSGHRGRVREEQ